MRRRLAVILGIRPDIIRASIILESLRLQKRHDVVFVWSGQHYSDNLKDVFFRDLRVDPPQRELGAGGATDAELVAEIIRRLAPCLEEIRPDAAVFLGDTNTVMGCLAAAQLNIPIVHIEGCMRSYDWRMPEEKYRTTIDHLSDVIYAYLPEYKKQGVAEGLNPDGIVVTTNPIVDVLQRHYFERKQEFDRLASGSFFSDRGIEKDAYLVMTCHRRENLASRENLERIFNLVRAAERTVYFAAGYRTQRVMREYGLSTPPNAILVDPIGYTELLVLLTNSHGVLTDSGTVVEECCILGIPSIQMRTSTERPQVYDVGSSVKFDPSATTGYDPPDVIDRLERIRAGSWDNPFGDGRASERIVVDLLDRLDNAGFRRHLPQCYHVPIEHSYRGDEL